MISTRDEMLLYEKCRKFLQTVHTKEIKEHHSKLEDFKQWCQTQEEIPPTITGREIIFFFFFFKLIIAIFITKKGGSFTDFSTAIMCSIKICEFY